MAIYNRKLNLLGIVLLVFLSIGATKDIVPRADGEGGIGDSVKNWDYGYIDNLYSDNIGIGTTVTTYDINVGGGTASSIDGVDDILVKGDIEVNSDIYVDGYLYGDGSQLTGISGGGHGDGTNCLDDYFAKGTDASGNAQGCTLIDSTIYESADATIYKESDIALIQAYIDTNLTFSSTGLTDTADLLYETELDDMTELEAQISDDIYVDGEIGLIETYMQSNLTFFTPTDIDTDYGDETITSKFVFADDTTVYFGSSDDSMIYWDNSGSELFIDSEVISIGDTGAVTAANFIVKLLGGAYVNSQGFTPVAINKTQHSGLNGFEVWGGGSSPDYLFGVTRNSADFTMDAYFDKSIYLDGGVFGVGTGGSSTVLMNIGGGTATNIDGTNDLIVADMIEADSYIYTDAGFVGDGSNLVNLPIDSTIYVESEASTLLTYMTENCSTITGHADLCDGTDDGGAETNTLSTLTTGIADDQVPTGTAADTVVYKSVPDCNAADRALSYEDSTNTWGCTTGFAAGSGDSVKIDTVDVADPDFVSTDDIDFIDTSNTITAKINDDVIVAGDFADADHGDVAWLANVATVQDLTCSDCIGGTEIAELADGDISDTLTASDLVAGGSVVSNSEVDDDITLTNITQITNRASTSLTDTADLLYETELDDMTKLEAQISDDIYVDGEASLLLAYMTDNCSTITGHADLCDGSDDGSAGGSEWTDETGDLRPNDIDDGIYLNGGIGIGTTITTVGTITVTDSVITPEISNTAGNLKIEPDAEGDVDFFGDTDVGDEDDGRIMYVRRKAAEGDSYFGFYIDKWKVGHFVDSGVDSIYFDSMGNYRINPNSNGHVYFFENAGVGDNKILRQSGYITNGSARRFISWKIDDTNDYFTLTKDGASLLGFDVQMPLVADSLTVDDLAECNTIDTSSGVLSCGTDEGWTALTDMTLTDTYIYVGNGSANPVGVDMTGDVGITNAGVTTVANDSHDHSAAGSTVTINAADITDISGSTDITADLEEEAHCDEHDGRSTTCATEVLNADEETYVFTAKIAFTDPVDTDDYFFHEAKRPVTITGIYCKTLVGTVDLDVSLAGTDINDSDITCTTSGVLDESLAGDTTMEISEEMALVIASVASSPTYLYVQVNGLYDD